MKRSLLLAFTLPLAITVACHRETGLSMSPAMPIDATVCEIIDRPEKYDGKLVRFKADFESDGIEHSVLVDPACKDHGVVPYDGPQLAPAEKAELERAIYTGRPGTLDKHISATFTGTFRWDAGHHQTSAFPQIARSIVLSSVSNLVVVRPSS